MRLQPVLALLLFAVSAPAQTRPHAAVNAPLAARPYMGWSSWSFLRGKPTEEKVKAQVDALFAAKLPDFGYRYINLDAGWSDGYDDHGVPKPNLTAFPSGMDGFGEYLHTAVSSSESISHPGIDPKLYDVNPIIAGTTSHIHDITDATLPGSTHKGSYKIDFTKPAARTYVNSIVQQFARWKVDFVKLDFVGPGGGNLPADNREEVRHGTPPSSTPGVLSGSNSPTSSPSTRPRSGAPTPTDGGSKTTSSATPAAAVLTPPSRAT